MACRADASGICNRSAGDAACEGGTVCDDSEDGPQGCVWACTAAADGMVPAGARQIDWIAGNPALLVARKQLLGKLLDVELSIRGILRGFGLKVGQVTRKTFEARIRELVTHVRAHC